MKFRSSVMRSSLRLLICFMFGTSAAIATGVAHGEGKPMSADVQAKVAKYKNMLSEWAAHPVIVAAVKESNKSAGTSTMTNVTWDALNENDPVVTAYRANPAGKLLSKWEDNKNIVKLFVRNEKGDLVAAGSSVKALLYNVANRPPFIGAMKGSAWAASEAKPDPATQLVAVQVSAPVKDGAKVIGVIHTGVSVQ
ncbi:MAG: hypothetical protein Q7J84_16905 [Sulfuricaulis sp.]|nr:hypothetical protein [Sulfuricaulis sp.]